MAQSAGERLLHTEICDIFDIRYPIMLAGMGGASCPKLVAAISNAGGLGVLGAAGCSPDELDAWIRETRSLTSQPFGVDTLLPSRVPEHAPEEGLRSAIPEAYWKAVEEIRREYNLPEPKDERGSLPAFTHDFFDKQIEAIMDNNVPVYAAGLGNPAKYIPEFHRRGTKVIGVVGNVKNARRGADSGGDVLIAQGHDAGGHNSRIGTLALIPQVVDAVAGKVPVAAAGGIGDGRGVVATMMLGARGAWIGTRFLATPEACIPEGQKQAIVAATEEDTMVSRYLTGKPVRMLKSDLPAEFEKRGLDPLPMPLMGLVSGSLFGGAVSAQRFDLNPGLGGQVIGMIQDIRPAAEVFEGIVSEAKALFEQIAAQIAVVQ